MNTRTHRTHGMTLIEVLAALLLLTVISMMTITLFLPTVTVSTNSRQRTLALRAAETWLDRYRGGQEPMGSMGTACTVSASVTTCSYPYGYAYPSGEWAKHDATLATIMQPMRQVVTVTKLAQATSTSLYSVQAQTFWREKGTERSVRLSTRINY